MSPTSATIFRKCQLRCDGGGYWGQVSDLSIILIGSATSRSSAHSAPFWRGFRNQVFGFPLFFSFFSFLFSLLLHRNSYLLLLCSQTHVSKQPTFKQYIFLDLHFHSCIVFFLCLVSSLFPVFTRNRQILN